MKIRNIKKEEKDYYLEFDGRDAKKEAGGTYVLNADDVARLLFEVTGEPVEYETLKNGFTVYEVGDVCYITEPTKAEEKAGVLKRSTRNERVARKFALKFLLERYEEFKEYSMGTVSREELQKALEAKEFCIEM